MNFQKTFQPDQTFKTTFKQDLGQLEDREEKFKLRQTYLTKNEQAMEEYRQRWTKGNHVFDRTYLGSQ